MASSAPTTSRNPHAVCVPYPAQGHIKPMMQLAKLLHCNGYHITFVNTDYNHQRLVRSWGPDSVRGFKDFRFKSMPDGLPPSDPDRTQNIVALCDSVTKNFAGPFLDLVMKINESAEDPPVTCIVSDVFMTFTQKAAEKLGVPWVALWTASACAFWSYFHYVDLVQKGYTPLKDEAQLRNGYMETAIDWIPGMPDIRLKDIPTFITTLNRDDVMLNFCMNNAQTAAKASAVIFNTFDELEHEVLNAIKFRIPQSFTAGPLLKLSRTVPINGLSAIKNSLWKEDQSCLNWLDEKEAGSVIYVNFGSITVISPQQLLEFAWGLAKSKYPFLWIIRPDLVQGGDAAILPQEFLLETRGRGLMGSWCSQEQVLNHPSVGLFLTHNGWNSMLESICAGVPMLCWPFFADQPTNCRYACAKWGMGMEIDGSVKMEALVKECMGGEKGKEMRRRANEWKESAEKASLAGGPSHVALESLLNGLLLHQHGGTNN
ncbi:7-deoxyloganetin glucosyltransferase-like [Nymphaea colorata]|nr:7-deoxyloganetin glucosyltransferase-like [Nymphaea colorata]XP_031492079.1 7-deoxyloganetin glucosyltransferase-like [Nymphaea colorata]